MKPSITWVAHYNDGGKLEQYPSSDEQVVNRYNDIDRPNLRAFDLIKDGRLLVRVDLRSVDIDEDISPRRLIYRKRNQATERGHYLGFYMVGWQRNVCGRNIQAINYVFEDGSVMLGGQFTDDPSFPMHPIAPYECEVDLVR